jgi:hypothetical protein
MSLKKTLSVTAGALLLATFARAQGATSTASATAGPAVKPDAVQKKAASQPPASAKKAKSIGKNVKVNTANSASDDDSFWVEKVDIDGDGNVDDANLLWDDEDKVLYAWKDGTFNCKKGGTGSGEMLIAVNAAGNARNRPAGSGFWVAALDKSECGSQTAGLWGCKFDAQGNETSCGMATLDEKNDELVIVAVSK